MKSKIMLVVMSLALLVSGIFMTSHQEIAKAEEKKSLPNWNRCYVSTF